MLSFLSISPLIIVANINTSANLFLIYLLFLLLKYFSSITLQSTLLSGLVQFDEPAFWITFITLVVTYMSLCLTGVFTTPSYLSYGGLVLCSYVVFSTSNFIVLYIFYELSLLPIIYIILKWGTYPDRFSSSVIMLLFTTVFSFPSILLVVYFSEVVTSPLLALGDSVLLSIPLTLLLLLCFAVNLPLYGLHYWLPMAHVEAPTSGSMILAGILLKLGGVSLLRISCLVSFTSSECLLLSYLCFSLIISSVVTSLQADFNRLVAYSSVVHITVLLIPLISNTSFSSSALLMIMVYHGLVSPIIFILVGWSYSLAQTRLLPLMQGMTLISYPLGLSIVLAFLMNIPTPPFSTFIAEIVLFLGIVNYLHWVLAFVLVYVFLSLVFNLVWLSNLAFGASNHNLSLSSHSSTVILVLISLYCFVFITYMSLFSQLF